MRCLLNEWQVSFNGLDIKFDVISSKRNIFEKTITSSPSYFIKGNTVAQIDFFLSILKVANIRCFILVQCSEQEARFKKYAIMS